MKKLIFILILAFLFAASVTKITLIVTTTNSTVKIDCNYRKEFWQAGNVYWVRANFTSITTGEKIVDQKFGFGEKNGLCLFCLASGNSFIEGNMSGEYAELYFIPTGKPYMYVYNGSSIAGYEYLSLQNSTVVYNESEGECVPDLDKKIEASNLEAYKVYRYAENYIKNNQGKRIDFIYYVNNGTYSLNGHLSAGIPTLLHVRILNESNGVKCNIKVLEKNGYNYPGLIQEDMESFAEVSSDTDLNGDAYLFILPTGGR